MKIQVSHSKLIVNGQLLEVSEFYEMPFVGDLVYEVIRVKRGQPIFLKPHLQRMKASADMMAFDYEALELEIAQGISQVIVENQLDHNNLKIIVGHLEGVSDLSYGIFPVPSFYPPKSYYEKGVKTILIREERKNPNAKVVNGTLSQRMDQLRAETDIFEGLLVDANQRLTEGSRSNLFFIKNHKIYTASSEHVLKGITRMKLYEICSEKGIEIVETELWVNEIHQFEACFISGTSIDLLPIQKIDNHEYSSAVHPLMIELMKAYEALI